MTARMDLTERLLTLGEPERLLLLDLSHARFADDDLLAGFAALGAGDARSLRERGLLRSAQGPRGPVHYLTATGQRAATRLLPATQSGGRAYAALRLEHEFLRARLYLALRQRGMPPPVYQAEPRLPYRSAAGLGERTLVPDARVEGAPAWLVEVDRGTEAEEVLRHKWLRYREWQLERGDARGRVAILAAGGKAALQRSLAATGLSAAVEDDAQALAGTIWPGGMKDG